jgi:hypothetical protein
MAAIGITGGAIAMIGTNDSKESIQEGYTEPVEYLNFTEPLVIKGNVVHISFTDDEVEEIRVDVSKL